MLYFQQANSTNDELTISLSTMCELVPSVVTVIYTPHDKIDVSSFSNGATCSLEKYLVILFIIFSEDVVSEIRNLSFSDSMSWPFIFHFMTAWIGKSMKLESI